MNTHTSLSYTQGTYIRFILLLLLRTAEKQLEFMNKKLCYALNFFFCEIGYLNKQFFIEPFSLMMKKIKETSYFSTKYSSKNYECILWTRFSVAVKKREVWKNPNLTIVKIISHSHRMKRFTYKFHKV